MSEQIADLDLDDDVPAKAPKRRSTASANGLRFKIFDGWWCEMKKLPVPLAERIALSAYETNPESPIAANIKARREMLRASLVRVGDMALGAGVTSEHLYASLDHAGIEQASKVYDLLHTSSDEEDAAFLASIEAF